MALQAFASAAQPLVALRGEGNAGVPLRGPSWQDRDGSLMGAQVEKIASRARGSLPSLLRATALEESGLFARQEYEAVDT